MLKDFSPQQAERKSDCSYLLGVTVLKPCNLIQASHKCSMDVNTQGTTVTSQSMH